MFTLEKEAVDKSSLDSGSRFPINRFWTSTCSLIHLTNKMTNSLHVNMILRFCRKTFSQWLIKKKFVSFLSSLTPFSKANILLPDFFHQAKQHKEIRQ